jgi:hypothetical protein
MAAQPDFWGEIGSAEGPTPLSILREQAALLGRKTQGLVEAKVDTATFDGIFTHSFKLVVPALDNYTYELFLISHGIDLYPVKASGVSDGVKWLTLESENAFLAWLQGTLSSPKTKKIIANLLAQATG